MDTKILNEWNKSPEKGSLWTVVGLILCWKKDFEHCHRGWVMGFVLWTRTLNVIERVLPQFFTTCKEDKSRKVESKLMSVFWNKKRVVHWEFMPLLTTVNSDLYCITMENLKQWIRWVRFTRSMFLFQHDNAQPHRNMKTRRTMHLASKC